MLNVALTGNIASGKSTVTKFFSDWGATIIDADAIVHDLQAAGQPMLEEIAGTFGAKAIAQDGSLDRVWLRQRILDDASAREALNAIVHPAVQQRREEDLETARQRGDDIVVNDIPLLFEVMDPALFDVVVLVEADETVRTKRLLERGLDRRQANALMATQMDSTLKRRGAHHIIQNDGTIQDLNDRCAEVWQELRERAAAASR